LVAALARTSSEPTGVQMIFLDYDVQAKLSDYAKAHGATEDQLARTFQYPHGRDEQAGLVRHWPHHTDHMHVRFKPAR
jgi:hypothetical protein